MINKWERNGYTGEERLVAPDGRIVGTVESNESALDLASYRAEHYKIVKGQHVNEFLGYFTTRNSAKKAVEKAVESEQRRKRK